LSDEASNERRWKIRRNCAAAALLKLRAASSLK
jgi:hypothetical protein